MAKPEDDRVKRALDALEGAGSAQSGWTTRDPAVRSAYRTLVGSFSKRIWAAYKSGRLSAKAAAQAATEARNLIMDAARMASTPGGRRAATAMKVSGRSFDYLKEGYAARLFNRAFDQLEQPDQTKVFEAMIEAAGRTSKVADANMRSLGATSRVFWVLTILLAAYDISSARNKVTATVHAVAVIGAGIILGEVFGGVVGSFAGPIGTGVGVVAGGVLGGWLVDQFGYSGGNPALTGH